MSALAELKILLESILPIETGVFSETPPNKYCVLTPLTDNFDVYADNKPLFDVQEIRISLFTKDNYTKIKKQIEKLLLDAEFTITERKYIGFDSEAKFHQYSIDIAKEYSVVDIIEVEPTTLKKQSKTSKSKKEDE